MRMPRPKVYDDDLRAALIAAGAEQLVEGGVGHLSLRAVAAAAGTSTNAVYALFGDKDGLVRAVVLEALESFAASQEASPVSGNPVEDLRSLARSYREWALSRPVLYAVTFGLRPAEVDQENLQRMGAFWPLLEGVKRAMGENQIIDGSDALTVALSFWSATHGLIALESTILSQMPRAARDQLFEKHLMALDHGWVRQS